MNPNDDLCNLFFLHTLILLLPQRTDPFDSLSTRNDRDDVGEQIVSVGSRYAVFNDKQFSVLSRIERHERID